MKKLMILSCALAAFAVYADKVPVVSDITITQAEDSRLVTITYTLANAPAVVTLDIQTNVTGNVWASIGGENIQKVSGDVWKKVTTDGSHTITWRPDLSWPDHQIENGGARAVVTAWSADNPPDYMVVNIAANATPNSETYYPAVEFLPGGLLKNLDYRTTKLVMRKIPAKGVTWTMGSVAGEPGRDGSREETHDVTLADNYYIGVFETTQAQWALVQTANQTPSYYCEGRLMRPVENVSYNDVRSAETDNTADATYDYPNAPNPRSFLGLLRAKTGLLFDLPSEAQWEFACRAGHGSGSWGDGSLIENASDNSTSNLARLGRFMYNGGMVLSGEIYVNPDTSCDVTNGTANVGSYAPNSWGLYDMHGNVWEWCLDWFTSDITGLGGAVNTVAGSSRVPRGGSWYNTAGYSRAAHRGDFPPDGRSYFLGFRLALPACPEGQSKQ